MIFDVDMNELCKFRINFRNFTLYHPRTVLNFPVIFTINTQSFQANIVAVVVIVVVCEFVCWLSSYCFVHVAVTFSHYDSISCM